MWRSDRARSEAILKLFEKAHLLDRGLWTIEGPTRLACDYLDKGSPLSHGENVVLKVAFDLWNGRGKITLDEILATLDGGLLRAVAEAVLARDR